LSHIFRTLYNQLPEVSMASNPAQWSIEWIFTKKNRLCWDCSLYQKCSVDLKYDKNALAAGAPPRTPLGDFTTLPRPLSRLGGGHPLPNPHHSRRLCRPDSRAFGAQLLLPPM